MFFFYDYEPYIAIIGDIKNSKKISDRRNIQNKLSNVLSTINKRYEEAISAKFMITLGDEFQGLLCAGEPVLDIIEEIKREMHPIQIRFGIGVGTITTDINSEMAIGADGPGYYNARTAIEMIKQNEKKNMSQSADVRIEMQGDDIQLSLTLNVIFSLMTIIQDGWSERQREIIAEYNRHNLNQSECAEHLGVAQSTIQRSLVKSNYYAYRDAKEAVSKILKEIKQRSV